MKINNDLHLEKKKRKAKRNDDVVDNEFCP